MLKERKYKITQIYLDRGHYEYALKIDTPKDIGVFSGVTMYRALREAWKATGIHMDFMNAELVKE